MVKRVAVIGAGSSGLACIKCCVDEGLEPVCFESSDDIGGLWRFKRTPDVGLGSIYHSLITNTSKEMMCFSDFPMPEHFPNYMHNSHTLQYLRLYAQHFDLLKHIRFQTTVRSVRQRPDFPVSGQWDVLTEDRRGEKERQVFDGVLVCSGQYTHPLLPDFPGIDTFPGPYLHSWEYKDPDVFLGKRVLVIGIGNSGGDIAVEASRVAEKTFLSTKKGSWVVGRMSSSGLPLDMVMIRRCRSLLPKLLPAPVLNWLGERGLNHRYDHRLYGLQPSHRLLDKRPLINDDLPFRILLGALLVKPNVREFRGSAVLFDDGTVEEGIDVAVFCTGYETKFPFLCPSLTSGPDGELTLYRHMIPPSLERPTLAVVGVIQTKGPIMPVAEMQARWATRVIKGLNQLPSEAKMHEFIERERKANMESYPSPKLAAVQVHYIPYLDALAREVGVLPNFLWLLLCDPRLGIRVFFGPCTPYQFRLRGPGRWEGARQAILTQWDRVSHPMRTRLVPESKSSTLSCWSHLSGMVVVILAVIATKRWLSWHLLTP
ncbi:dimethylaniline monooxygenase [N-oxide-forming] 2 [Chanos chanos]|uniref:Flavin-containing monooxygenase n=1 Tax=Chanos chanos TaxID=29144 RepID=A0A6J2V441_CHACN|nr:dimethylaniline monooxygenase [N-oxide-forming] 2-like [Chanos chanos]